MGYTNHVLYIYSLSKAEMSELWATSQIQSVADTGARSSEAGQARTGSVA